MKLLATVFLSVSFTMSPVTEWNDYSDTGHSPQIELHPDPRLMNIGGLSYKGNLSYCVGTIIPPDTVLTNAHCLVEHGKRNNIPFEFVTAELNATKRDHFAIDNPRSMAVTSDPDNQRQLDIAFLKLSRPVDPNKFPDVSISSIESISGYDTSQEEKIKLTGLSHGRFAQQQDVLVTEACEETAYYTEVHLFFHNCSTNKGMSGSPLYIIRDGKLTIVGMHAGGRGDHTAPVRYDDSVANIAVNGDTIAMYYTKYKNGVLKMDAY